MDEDAQRRPEHKPRRHLSGTVASARAAGSAQRRPEHKPRRHMSRSASSAAVMVSNAQRRPEHKPRRHSGHVCGYARRSPSLNEGRSINPGDTWRRWRRLWMVSLNEGRSINPGDTGQVFLIPSGMIRAQRRPEHKPRRHQRLLRGSVPYPHALNEGRSINPGDTRRLIGVVVALRRSTKAGA